jgi:hypothetical protein
VGHPAAFKKVRRKWRKPSYTSRRQTSEHGSQLLRFEEISPKLKRSGLWSQEHFPFKRINVDLAVRTLLLPESRGKSEEEAWLPSTEELMGCRTVGIPGM